MEIYIHPLAYRLELSEAFRWLRFFGIIAAAVLGFSTLKATNHLSPMLSIIAANVVVIMLASAFILLPEAISLLRPTTKILAYASATRATFFLEREIHIDLQAATSVSIDIPSYFTHFNWPGARSNLRIEYDDHAECIRTKFQYRPLIQFIENVNGMLQRT